MTNDDPNELALFAVIDVNPFRLGHYSLECDRTLADKNDDTTG